MRTVLCMGAVNWQSEEIPYDQLPGRVVSTPHGEAQLIESFFSEGHCHGRQRISEALDVSMESVAKLALSPELADVDPKKMLFLDTETTGLSGGANTVPFLIGVGYFEGKGFTLKQLLLSDIEEEKPILSLLAEYISTAECLVTFNGKSFDWPLLRTRFVINRVKVKTTLPHLDLLHCARRVFKSRLSSTRLVDIEKDVFGMRRVDDTPGWAIPGIYFDYIEEGDAGPLHGIVKHNGHDLVALAALLGRLGRHFDKVQAGDDPRDHLAFAKVAERVGDKKRANAFAKAATKGKHNESSVQAWLLAARMARRAGDTADEERSLIAALGVARDEWAEAEVRLALAKLYEHRRKDLKTALEHALHTQPAEDEDAQAHRANRLRRRLEIIG